MKRFLGSVALLAVVGLALAGCAGAAPKNSVVKEATLSEQDAADSKATLEAYFNAVAAGDNASIEFYFDSFAASKKEKPAAKPGTATFEVLQVDKVFTFDGAPTVYYTITVDVGSNPAGAWKPGINERYGVTVKREHGWKVKGMAHTPPTYPTVTP
jgi:hypothetical protein